MVPWDHEPAPKRHLYRLSHFVYTAKFQMLFNGTDLGDLDTHKIHGFMGPPKSAHQTISRLVQQTDRPTMLLRLQQ